MTNFSVWSRSQSRPFLSEAGAGAGADLNGSESASGLWASGAGAAQKSGGSATLDLQNIARYRYALDPQDWHSWWKIIGGVSCRIYSVCGARGIFWPKCNLEPANSSQEWSCSKNIS